jgi:osmoprotectant transport system ATP-binding protein
MIRLHSVTKRYDGRTAVDALDWECAKGETHALIGPSGCGKSTLLRLIVWLIRPDRGTVEFDGQPITPQRVRDVRHRIGYVIQEGGLFPHLTARQNATLMPQYFSWDPERTQQRLESLARLTHLELSTLERFPGQLSGGQRQRVSLIRALMLDPDVLLLDEPLEGLDPIIRAELQSELREIVQELGKTVVLVTHNLAEAGFLAERITLLRNGKIVQQGTLDDLLERPATDFVTRFVNAQRSDWRANRADAIASSSRPEDAR